MTKEIVDINVRGIDLKLMAFTRSLRLCARMNYETENLDFIDEISKGEIFFDCGACEGRFSIYAGLKGLKVYSFEPEKLNFETISENVNLNNLSNVVKTFQLALGEKDKEGILNIGQPWAGGHQKVVESSDSRTDLTSFEFKSKQEITIISLDNFLANNPDIPNPNYLKIDVDGSEYALLKGAQKTISNSALKGILIELNKNDENLEQLIEDFSSWGFKKISEFPIPNEPELANFLFKKR
ncbi:MAG: FkbM family methyltransferase [bacterium]|nr:FkbM family methyltransferase [bacterium]